MDKVVFIQFRGLTWTDWYIGRPDNINGSYSRSGTYQAEIEQVLTCHSFLRWASILGKCHML